jgi:hypothetical protein
MSGDYVQAELPKAATGSCGLASITAAVWQDNRVEAIWRGDLGPGLAYIDIGNLSLGYTPDQWAVIIRLLREVIPPERFVVDAVVESDEVTV